MKGLWTVEELSEYLKVPVQTLYQWRTRRYGPPGVKMGKHLRYRPEDVERWVKVELEAVA